MPPLYFPVDVADAARSVADEQDAQAQRVHEAALRAAAAPEPEPATVVPPWQPPAPAPLFPAGPMPGDIPEPISMFRSQRTPPVSALPTPGPSPSPVRFAVEPPAAPSASIPPVTPAPTPTTRARTPYEQTVASEIPQPAPIPNPFDRAAGAVVSELDRQTKPFQSGENVGNYISDAAAFYRIPGFAGRNSGTRIGETIGDVPVAGPPGRRLFDIVGTPLSTLPVVGGLGLRQAAEISVGGVAAREAARRAGLPDWAQTGADIVGSAGAPFIGPSLEGAAGRAAVGYRDLTKNLPAGASIKDVSDPALQEALPALRDQLAAEVSLRRSGQIEAEKTAGRALQAGRIAGNLEGARAAGATLEESLQAASAGAKVGQLRQTFNGPLELTEAHTTALANHLQDSLAADGAFTQFNGLKALNALVQGENVQPAQLKLLRRVFGEDIGKLAQDANVGRPSPVAELTPEAQAAIDRAGQIGERQIATYEQRAQAQAQHADTLTAQFALDPTNARLKAVADDARARGLAAQNRADELTIAQGRSYADAVSARNATTAARDAQAPIVATENAAQRAERIRTAQEITGVRAGNALTPADHAAIDTAGARKIDESVVTRAEILAQRASATADKLEQLAAVRAGDPRYETQARLARQHADTLATAADDAARRLSESSNAYGTAQQARAQAAAPARQSAADLAAAERADRLNPNEQMIVDKAKAKIGEIPGVSSAYNQQAIQSVEAWLRGNRAILDGMGETTHETLRNIAATMSGNLADSYLTTLYQRRALIEGVLRDQQGVEAKIAKQMANLLTEAKLKARYPQGVPARPQAEIARTKAPAYGNAATNIAQGAAQYGQEWKNLAFGPADVGVFGQQVLHAATASPTNILAGVVNRTLSALHMPSIPTTFMDDLALSKRVQYALDGVPQGISTGIVQDDPGLVLSRLGPAGRTLSRFIQWNSDWQFGKVLGGLRNLNYEGNLVALHLTGQDIANPAVRATAAGMANSATSFAPAALRSSRALGEKALLMTPSMRRAQVTTILQLGRVFSPTATAPQRILGSIAILNLAGSTLAIGKLLNDRIGKGDFEFDPSKPNFGNVVTGLKNSSGANIVLNLFPQQQVATTILKAARSLAEADPMAAAQTWGKLFMSSSGPIAGVVEHAAGFGYQPGKGYRFGDMNDGLSGQQRIINMLPIPPILQSYMQGGMSPGSGAFEFAGAPNFPESASQALARGDSFENLSPTQQLAGLRSQSWQQIAARPGLKDKIGDATSYGAWYSAHVAELAQQLRASGKSEAQAQFIAEKAAAVSPVAKQYSDLRNRLEDKWGVQHPKEAAALLDSEAGLRQQDRTFQPTAPVRAYIEKYGRGTATPPAGAAPAVPGAGAPGKLPSVPTPPPLPKVPTPPVLR